MSETPDAPFVFGATEEDPELPRAPRFCRTAEIPKEDGRSSGLEDHVTSFVDEIVLAHHRPADLFHREGEEARSTAVNGHRRHIPLPFAPPTWHRGTRVVRQTSIRLVEDHNQGYLPIQSAVRAFDLADPIDVVPPGRQDLDSSGLTETVACSRVRCLATDPAAPF